MITSLFPALAINLHKKGCFSLGLLSQGSDFGKGRWAESVDIEDEVALAPFGAHQSGHLAHVKVNACLVCAMVITESSRPSTYCCFIFPAAPGDCFLVLLRS